MSDRTIDGLRYEWHVRSYVDTSKFVTFRCRRCAGEFAGEDPTGEAMRHICVPIDVVKPLGVFRGLRVQHQSPPNERFERLADDLLQLTAKLEAEAKAVSGG